MKKLIYVCSKYRGEVDNNVGNAKSYCNFVAKMGQVPYAPHLHNTRFLDDNDPKERELGISLGLEILKKSDEMWVFGDEISEGMNKEIKEAKKLGLQIKYIRTIKQLMKKTLINGEHLTGDKSNIWGDAKNISGDVSHISGDVSNISGDVSFISGDVTNKNGCYLDMLLDYGCE